MGWLGRIFNPNDKKPLTENNLKTILAVMLDAQEEVDSDGESDDEDGETEEGEVEEGEVEEGEVEEEVEEAKTIEQPEAGP